MEASTLPTDKVSSVLCDHPFHTLTKPETAAKGFMDYVANDMDAKFNSKRRSAQPNVKTTAYTPNMGKVSIDDHESIIFRWYRRSS